LIENNANDNDTTIINNNNNNNNNNDNQNIKSNESVSFDFFVNIALTINDCEKIKVVIAKSVNVSDTQITIKQCEDISINKPRSRVCGTVIVNSDEIEPTYTKFSCLISQRTLSEVMKNVFELQEQPRVSRFYVRCSNSKINHSNSITEAPLNNTNHAENCSSENKTEKNDSTFDQNNNYALGIMNYEPLYVNYMMEQQCVIL